MITNDLRKLNNRDIYSLILFALFKIKDIKEYSTISELAYVLDQKNLLSLCEYFGGLTITIPKISDLENLVYSLIVFNDVNIEKADFEKTLNQLPLENDRIEVIKDSYIKLCEILKDYEFVTQ